MLAKVVDLFIRRTVKGPAQSWLFTSAIMLLLGWAKKATLKTQTVELENLRPGDKYLIENLNVTHGEQLKAEKATKKAAKKERKALKRKKKTRS